MPATASYGSISGNSAGDFCCIAQRFDDSDGDFDPDCGESWVYHFGDDDDGGCFFGGQGWLTGVWYSPGRAAYVVDADGEAMVFRDPVILYPGQKAAKGQITKVELDASLFGVWGLDDRFVLAWGDHGDGGRIWRWDGKVWAELPKPPGTIMDVQGLAPDLVIAVGYHGMIAHWNGRKWTQLASPTRAGLNAVTVVSPDEMYACSSSGVLLEGSVHGWAEALDEGIPLFGVAKFKDNLYVGAGDKGLFLRKGQKLVPFKPTVKATTMEARKDLLVVADKLICTSTDGQRFDTTDEEFVLETLINEPECWK